MKRPWNRSNSNIYSLVTFNDFNDFNMNICTYVSVVNMNPRQYIIAIDYNTLTYSYLAKNVSKIILQSLSIKNIGLVKNLGKKSGFNFDKQKYLKHNNLITSWKETSVLKNTSFLVELKDKKKIFEMNDHCLFLFSVKSFKNFANELLTFDHLINKKIIL